MKVRAVSFRSNAKLARQLWGEPSPVVLRTLRELTLGHSLSIAAGDLQLLEGRWYVTHAGLLRVSQRKRCSGIHTALQKDLCDPALNRWVFKATIYKSGNAKGFVGYGDADPSNCSSVVQGAEMRVAETRAKSRSSQGLWDWALFGRRARCVTQSADTFRKFPFPEWISVLEGQ
jgi:hypothetical protein